MTELVVAVKLKADGSGLVGQANISRQAVEQLGTSAKKAGGDAQAMAAGTAAAAASATELASAEAQAGAAVRAFATDQRQAATAVQSAVVAQGKNTAAANDNAKALARQGFAVRNVGQQFGDFGLQIASGADPARAFSQQVGQLGYALGTLEKGPLRAVGAFLVGPWGIAFTVALAVLAPFVEELFKAGDAADAAKVGASGLADAQSVLGDIFDLTSGKLKKQNELLILNARLTAINLRADGLKKAASSREAFANAGTPTLARTILGTAATLAGGDPLTATKLFTGNKASFDLASQAQRANALTDEKARAAGLAAVLAKSEKTDFSGGKITKTEFQQAVVDGAASRANAAIADLIDKSLDDGKLATGLRRDAKTKKPPKPKSTAAVDEFGRDAASKIAGVADQYDDTPPSIRQANTAIRGLNDLIDDLSRKKPPNFRGLIADAERVKGLVESGLNKPFNDFIDAQQQSYQIQQLLVGGHEDEAAALRVVVGLERQQGPLTLAQKDAVLASVEALRAQQRQIDINREHMRPLLDALGSIKGIVQDATQDFVRGDLGKLIKSPGKLLDAFQSLKGEQLFDKLFSGLFADLKDQVEGTSVVKDAAATMAKAVDGVSTQTNRTSAALSSLEASATGAANAVAAGSAAAVPQQDLNALLAKGNGVTGPPIVGQLAALLGRGNGVTEADAPQNDIVVTGRRNPTDIFSSAIGGLVAKAGGKLGLTDDQATKLGGTIGKFAGKGLEGAATGSIVAGVSGALGIKLSKTGSQIGGALGGLTGLPGGDIIGSVLGGLVGKLFAPKAKPGGVTVGNVDGSAGQTGTSGSDKKLIVASGGLGDAISNGLNQIVQQLGGQLGNFSVSIGKYKDDLRVNENGKALGGVKNSGAVGFGDDEAAAVSYAISRAIAQGAVQGLSAAVAKALKSSTDIDKAIAEALKVADLEKLLGGLTGQLTALFKDFDAQAADRVTLAKKYGLDLLQVEKINAEQRADLLDQTLKSRVGSLTDLLSNLQFGDLFEGSASDRRKAILGEIDDAKADALAGVAGAADRLADLERQLVSTSKEAFGTAGPEYATDRSSAIDNLQRVIQAETDRVNAAAGLQQTQTDAVVAGVALTNETNDLIVGTNQRLDALAGIIGKGYANDYSPNLDLIIRRQAS